MPMSSADVGHGSFLSASSAYHSCTGDTSENYDQDSVYSSYSREAEDAFKEPEVITKKHYDTLGRSLANRPRLEPANFRSDAREKIARLTRVQFLELAMDVHDEVARTNSKQKIDFVPSSGDSCHPHRHEARQKIAKLHLNVLKDLMSDIFYELGRRYPKFKEAETLPEQTGVSRSKNNSPCEFKLDAITPMNLNFFDIDEDSRAGGGTREGEHSTKLPDIISRSMSISQVVSVLEDHGCPNITDKIDPSTCSSTPVAGGGFGDVHHGILRNGSEVAIKCARVFATDAELGRMDFKSAASELYAWSKYRHRNVVELLGLAHFRDRIAMVSPWMTNGTLNQYLKRFPSADRCRICSDIASGLSYLHQMGTIHGDVKGLNVLFSSDGTAKLIDFGNSALRSSTLQFTGSHAAPTFSTRWTAPELLVGSGAYTLEGDVYALGMTILEVISGEIPFPEIKSDVAVMGRVLLQKMPPDRPQTSIPMMSKQGNILWKLLEECWSYDPQARPQASHVQSQVSEITCEGLKTFSLTDQDWFERFIPDISQSLGMSLN